MGVKGVKGKGYRTKDGDGVEWGLCVGLNGVRGHGVKGQRSPGSERPGGQGSMGVKGVKGKGYKTKNGDGVEWESVGVWG